MDYSLFNYKDDKDLDKKLKIIKMDKGDYKIEDPTFEQKFQKDLDDFIKNRKKEKREKADGGIFKQYYSDDFNFKNPGFLSALSRKEPWALKRARSDWTWNTKTISKSKFNTGNELFDWYTNTINLDWWLDQIIMLPFNLWNVVGYQIEKKENRKKNDEYISKLNILQENDKDLSKLADPVLFQKAAMELVGKKGDKRGFEERLSILFHVANRNAKPSKEMANLRKDIVDHAAKKVNLIDSFQKNAENIFGLIDNKQIAAPDQMTLDLKQVYDAANGAKPAEKWKDIQENHPDIFLNVVQYNKQFRKDYPYNNPEKYQAALDEIYDKYKDNPAELKKKLEAFNKSHQKIASIQKDKKGKEITYKPDNLADKSDIEKAIFGTLNNQQQAKFLSQTSMLKNAFFIAGNTPEEKKQNIYGYLSKVLKDDIGITDPKFAKFQMEEKFSKIKDIAKKLENDFRKEVKDNPDMDEDKYKLLRHELDLKIKSLELLFSAFGKDDSYKLEKDKDLKAELKEKEDEKSAELKKLSDFKKTFDDDLKAFKGISKDEYTLDFKRLNYALAYTDAPEDDKRRRYIEELDGKNSEVRNYLAVLSNPANKLMDKEDEGQDNEKIKELLAKYKKVIKIAEDEAKAFKKYTNETNKQKREQLKDDFEELQKEAIEEVKDLKEELLNTVQKLEVKDAPYKHTLGFNTEKGKFDSVAEEAKLKKNKEAAEEEKDKEDQEKAEKANKDQERADKKDRLQKLNWKINMASKDLEKEENAKKKYKFGSREFREIEEKIKKLREKKKSLERQFEIEIA